MHRAFDSSGRSEKVKAAMEIKGIEFHDAVVAAITVEKAGKIEISFSHVSAYVDRGAGRTEVWSYAGHLQLLGVTEFMILGTIGEDDYVADGDLSDSAGNGIDLVNALNGFDGFGRLDLVLAGSATKVKAICSGCRFTDLRPIKMLEEWEGD